jgi:predicted phosphodiesterase
VRFAHKENERWLAMKIWIFSDLHLDVDRHGWPPGLLDDPPEHDVVVIAGDVCEGHASAAYALMGSGINSKPVVYVTGNHECYGHHRSVEFQPPQHQGLHLLQDSAVRFEDVTFVGATLWTDYCLYGEVYRQMAMHACADKMNDHRRIRHGSHKWMPSHAAAEHAASRDYIKTILDQRDGPVVVVTHHAPSIKSVPDRYHGDLINTGFASHMDDLASRATLWVHGHTHDAADYTLGDCRVICNPRGYARHGGDGFNPRLVVEVGT